MARLWRLWVCDIVHCFFNPALHLNPRCHHVKWLIVQKKKNVAWKISQVIVLECIRATHRHTHTNTKSYMAAQIEVIWLRVDFLCCHSFLSCWFYMPLSCIIPLTMTHRDGIKVVWLWFCSKDYTTLNHNLNQFTGLWFLVHMVCMCVIKCVFSYMFTVCILWKQQPLHQGRFY